MGRISKCNKSYIRRIIHSYNGGLLLVSVLISLLIFTSCEAVLGSNESIGSNLNIVIGDVSGKDLLAPFAIGLMIFMFFFVFVVIDVIVGIQASFHAHKKMKVGVNKRIIKKEKLYKPFWKILTILFITLMFCCLSITFMIFNIGIAYKTVIFIKIIILVSATLFEFNSIGDNLEKIFGKKPEIFTFVGKLFRIARKRVIEKAKGSTIKD